MKVPIAPTPPKKVEPKKVIPPAPKVIEPVKIKDDSLLFTKFHAPSYGQEIFEEDAALIEALLEEDDSLRVAREVRDAAFDGKTHPNP